MNHINDFIHDSSFSDSSDEVRHQTLICTLDLIGALCGGQQTRLSRIIRDHVAQVFGGDQATIFFDGRRCSPPGAALANGMTIDAMDIHDSYRESLGHAGVHIYPTVFAVAEQLAANHGQAISGQEFITTVVVAYDISCRAAVVLHNTVSDYHTSGAWGAVSSAAIYSRMHGLTPEQTRHALGIAEYHGPRSQMMRVIDHPVMLKDGSGWGAMAGVSAGMLAQQGFTGAPAITVEAEDVADYWTDLGNRWLIMEQGFKGHAVCWWAQPAIEASLKLVRYHDIEVDDIDEIEVYTFDKATRLAHPRPATTEEAQYSLPYPVAAALRGMRRDNGDGWYGLGPHHLLDDALNDESILTLAERVTLIEAPDLTAQFPGRFLARVKITTVDGRVVESGDTTFRGELDFPFSDAELIKKYRWLVADILPAERVAAIEQAVFALPRQGTIQPLLDLMATA